MGIHGIYKEIGPGRRVALSKLAVDKFEETGRPLRIAIDTSIWLFQIQASKGGTNPALRTFYYRLLRLVALAIHPVFVFDGPNKPPFKRNKRTGPNVASIPEFLAKQLLKQFGYPIHLAPGEAEAECALLQREGIVDAVLSEDVDTLMFGSGVTIRNWSPEKSGNTPTHVNVYDAVETKAGPSALDREGMILVALMSGGDYVPEGIPGCGPKTACEAAKAGFGEDLCKIPRNDARAMSQWRERLQHELKTNESKLFKRKHGALKIPDNFPRLDILGYYTHPAISNQAGLDKLRRAINWDQELDLPGLRDFTHDAFDWVQLEGAKHFIRSLAPSLLVRSLRLRAERLNRLPTHDLQAVQEDEALLVKGIHGKRQHAVTDSTTELRVSFKPIELVKIDLEKEDPDDNLSTPPPDSQTGEADLDDLELNGDAEAAPKKRGPSDFDPHAPARIWVLETFVKVGVPLKVQDWEAERQTKLKPKKAATVQEPSKTTAKAKGGAKRTKPPADMPQAPIANFAKVTKPGISRSGANASRALAKLQECFSDPPPAVSQPVPRTNDNVIELLSSSPVRSQSTRPAPLPAREKSLSPIDELPPSVTKRRRRAPIQRSRTIPTDSSAPLERPNTPPPLDTVETLDLVDSPVLPSPSQLPAKKARMRIGRNAPLTRTTSDTSITSSPSRSRQTTLDAWRASSTPTKLREMTTIDAAPFPAPLELRPSQGDIDTLDLTLSSPTRAPPARSRRAAPARPPLNSISSNTSLSSTSSTSALPAKKKAPKTIPPTTRTRRPSPRLKSASPEIDTLDLTSPQLVTTKSTSPETHTLPRAVSQPSSKPTSPEIDTLDLSLLSSPTIPTSPPPPVQKASPPPRRSPRAHTSSDPACRTSPPAAWKAREKKKRQIILRKSVVGAWDFVDVDVDCSLVDGGDDAGAGAGRVVLKGKERRRWRESEIEVLDLS
ncbi:flap structure-specific endonuclease-like protein [Dothidotthia symphoricarpi CBS 119687]|uniref:Flap structure-specific endonuclease-like protein n=1 Tax=Dothidotthia symphoricarpi CBS 119687 TaxID=1392245 RepID=A0A6A6AER2_9PLEO|nr:flap structure-specific endonuclease-like protein [Dothidotthia symphoricarpi CBS 119687]KAF2130452.1 flap structure-specific endonuclease-like protein [Dothidotthia symphoricarpi CBS 119687]